MISYGAKLSWDLNRYLTILGKVLDTESHFWALLDPDSVAILFLHSTLKNKEQIEIF